MSHRFLIPLLVAAALLTSCQGGGSPTALLAPLGQTGTPPQQVVASLGAIGQHAGYIESALGLYQLSIDASNGSATSELLATRSLQDNDDLYELSITNFLRRDSFTITGVERTATTLDVHYTFAHPFPAPSDPAGSPNGSSNRADLGVAGRIMLLADVASSTGNTYFTDVIANTALLANADAYYQPAGLLNLTATANAFPYKLLVDESGPDGNRSGIANGGDPTGNFGSDGWTRTEFGATNDAWTGYGVLHQGQVSRDTLSFDLNEFATGLDLTIAVLAKYNDPRGGTNSIEKRGNRLPPASPDHTRFAYRMPHGALDVERISFEGESGGFEPNTISSSTLRFRVIDWDARATETSFPDLFEDGDLNAVAAGESGAPALEACIPGVLGDATTVETFDPGDLLDDDSAVGGDVDVDSGRPDDALFFERTITKPIGVGQSGGAYTGLVRAIDPEPAGTVVALDGTTLAPLSANFPEAVTYQAFEVAMSLSNLPPEFLGTIGLKLRNPCLPTPATFVIENRDLTFSDPESDAITFTVVATPDVGSPVTVSGITTFPISNAATGPWVNPTATQVTFDVYANDAAHPGATGTLLPGIYAPSPLVGRVSIPAPWVDVYGGGSAIVFDQTIAPNGDLYVGGYYTGTADLNPGAGVDSHPSAGNWDCYVSRFDPTGNFVWARHMGGAQYDYVDALAVDAAGNVYCSGRFQESFDFDPGAGVAVRSVSGNPTVDMDGFIWSLDATGNFRWGSVFGSPAGATNVADWAFDIALDPGGNPTCVGRTDGLADFDPGPGVQQPPSLGFSDSFLLTLNAVDGSFVRVLRMGNSGGDNFSDIAFDNAGGLLLSGVYNGTMDFDPGPGVVNRVSTGGAATYILKLNAADLSHVWVANLDTQLPAGQTWYGMAVDTAGDVYLTATYAGGGTGDMDAGLGTAFLPPVAGVWDAFMVAYTSTGDYKWHSVAGGTAIDWGRSIVVIDQTVFWGGGFTGTNVDFDPSAGSALLSSAGSQDAFIAAYNSKYGFFEGAARIGSTGIDEVYQLSQANLCDPILGGWTQGTVDYDPGPGTQSRPATGSFSAYLLKLNGGTLAF